MVLNKRDKQLLNIYRSLQPADAETLLAFAEFLAARQPAESRAQLTLNPIERPADETVIAAIKRLTGTYPMLDKDRILNETSALVAQHLMQGRAAAEVIDELEGIFNRHYTDLQEQTD